MSKIKREWVGELFEIRCSSCNKFLTVKLIAEDVIDEETGEPKTKFIDEECECGFHLEYFLQNGATAPISTSDTND